MIDNNKRLRVFNRDHYICQFCEKQLPYEQMQAAHGIAKTKANAKMIKRLYYVMFKKEITISQAWEIIDSEENLFTSCAGHNSRHNFGNNPGRVEAFLQYYNSKMEMIN